MRIVQSERVFQAVERSKHEHERFYRASTALNRALTLEEVYAAALEGARGVCDFDFAAIAPLDARDGSQVIGLAAGEGSQGLLGTRHRDPASIASMVVKNKLALPVSGEWRDRHETHIFEAGEGIKGFESLYVLPLLVKDEVLGMFACAARRAGAFPSDRREMLGVVANQVAISLQNGRMVQSLEEQATTDGLTGPGQPSHLPGTLLRHARPRRPAQAARGHAAHRHRPFQEGQRHLRPPHRRCGA